MTVPAWAEHRDAIEARTQAIGRDLLETADRYRPGAAERIEDWLLTRAVGDDRFRQRLLRFIDVLGSLDFPGSDEVVVRLLREYFADEFPAAPRALRWLIRAGRAERVPVPVAARTARRSAEVFARRFIVAPGDETVHEVIAHLADRGRLPSFDLLGEAVLSESEAEAYVRRYLRLIEQLSRLPGASERTQAGVAALQVSIKLSSLTHHFTPVDPEGSIARARPALERVCEAAREAGVGVTIDMEQYELRDLTWELFTRVFARGEPLGDWADAGMVLQAYLREADRHVEEVVDFARQRGVPFQVRLAKGAYWDYETIVAEANRWPCPVYEEKRHTDAQFERALEALIDARDAVHLAVASHNPRAHARAAALAEAAGLPPDRLEYQTLHRTAEGISRGLVEQGWTSRDYVPVGELLPGMAYLVRRVLENAAQAGFLMQHRRGVPADQVLAPPTVDEAPPARVRPLPGAFQRAPKAPWYVRSFREGFEHALRETRSQWGEEFPLVIGEERLEGDAHLVHSPSHPAGPPVGMVRFARGEHVDPAVRLAARGAEEWSSTAVAERAAILRRAAERLEDRGHEFAAWIVHEGGRDREGAWGEVEEAADFINRYASDVEALDASLGDRVAPRGVVAMIPPWNFSLAIPCGMTAAALLCGNTVVLKPAEQTPLIARRMVELLHEAGVPRSALVYLPGFGEDVGAPLVEHPDVAMVAFTGSREVGTALHETAAHALTSSGRPKAITAEMGGKNPAIVFADADLDETVEGLLTSVFGHANQKCSAISRVLVQRPIYDRLAGRLSEAAASMIVGPADEAATQINPIIEAGALDRLRGAAERARSEDTVLYDAFERDPGTQLAGPLIVEVPLERALDAWVATEELFGPILVLIPFDDAAEAYRVANGTTYGLTSGVFSRSPETVQRAARALVAGHVYVNRSTTAARPGVEPFGGLLRSGTGPKVGHREYLWAFLRRTDSEDRAADDGDVAPAGVPDLAPALWEAPLHERIELVERASVVLSNAGERVAASALHAAAQQARRELAQPAPTVPVVGQQTEMWYEVARGLGLLRARGEAATWWLAVPLLAGNALVVLDSPELDPVLQALWEAGVPPNALRSLPGGVPELLAVARSPAVAFAALDGGPLRAVLRSLGPTTEDQRWLKALISPLDGPQPGEPGFLHRFAWSKVIAVRTLRHGADLALTSRERPQAR